MTEPTPYEIIGGDAVVRALVDRFYDLMDEMAEAAALRAIHATSLTASRDKLYWFLTGWLGGPPMYAERQGHPRLRARHLPFHVDSAMRDAWMRCMNRAIAELVTDAPLRAFLVDRLTGLADHMRNQPDPGDPA